MSYKQRHLFNRKQMLVARVCIWLLAEIWLNYLGLDDLADYSEFLFERHVVVASRRIMLTADS